MLGGGSPLSAGKRCAKRRRQDGRDPRPRPPRGCGPPERGLNEVAAGRLRNTKSSRARPRLPNPRQPGPRSKPRAARCRGRGWRARRKRARPLPGPGPAPAARRRL
ncbi:hypothetical protein QTO34_001988 [Cnephaeus nilssonii]|uniref:Uncharacterized protein n=1 Tax=Cnephaeus nilssonii TaxID=3371016 RepID=A0AA40HUZ0_CNENI|nr:hypothetical protein QTO34_001988 [Eptesicus nilssonii]